MTSPADQSTNLETVYDIAEMCTGRRPSQTTVWRWVRKGTRGVKLNAAMVFGKWRCTRQDFGDFIAAQTHAALERGSNRDREDPSIAS